MEASANTAVAGLLLVLALGGCAGEETTAPSPIATPTPAPDPPNVVLILADDLGWGDVSMNGGEIPTPHIDRLALEGARFQDFYVPAAVCAPSRASLMTGQWPPLTGIPWNPPDRLRADQVVIAEPLHAAGYRTAMLGKWHLGWDPPDMPIHWGFDYFYGIVRHGFILGDSPTDDTSPPERVAEKYVSYALDFIAEGPGAPFFVYLAHRDVHQPYHPGYVDAVTRLDRSVGQLLEGLESMGLDRNTLVLFMSDNGPVDRAGSSGPFNGRKGSCEEGAVRVPAAARWPARIPAGRTIEEIVSTLDVFPTLVELAGVELPPGKVYPGRDITRLLTGHAEELEGEGVDGGREVVFWQEGGAPTAIRSGRWKYLRPGSWNPAPTLHDIEADPGETHDLSEEQPEIVERLERRLEGVESLRVR